MAVVNQGLTHKVLEDLPVPKNTNRCLQLSLDLLSSKTKKKVKK